MSGILYIVATPIGHRDDITHRAVQVLKSVHCIIAEDTRTTKGLLQHYQIRQPIYAYHNHNEMQRTDHWIAELESGKDIALVSDAGTPLICDPGYRLVHAAKLKDITVVPLPGPCAFVAAVQASGLPSHALLFKGFFPKNERILNTWVEAWTEEDYTLIGYESVHRMGETLSRLKNVLPPNQLVCVARELTKQFEQIMTGSIEQVCEAWLQAQLVHKGEFVIMISPYLKDKVAEESREYMITSDQLLTQLMSKLSLKDAVALTVDMTQLPKKQIYSKALEIQSNQDADE